MSARIMSLVPLVSSPDQDLHFVLCDFGHYGRAYVETDPAQADASTIVRKLLQGQFVLVRGLHGQIGRFLTF